MGQVMPSDAVADSDDPPETPIVVPTPCILLHAYHRVTHQQSGSMRVSLFFCSIVVQSLQLVQSPSPTQLLRVTIRLIQSNERALHS